MCKLALTSVWFGTYSVTARVVDQEKLPRVRYKISQLNDQFTLMIILLFDRVAQSLVHMWSSGNLNRELRVIIPLSVPTFYTRLATGTETLASQSVVCRALVLKISLEA